MKIYNVFSDGIYLKYTDGIRIYNNKIINCQHEGFFLSACQNTDIHDNKISGICSDGGRFMNSRFYKVRNNVFVSFSGDSFGAFKGGEAGLQIGDQINQVDHGFAPSYKPFTTDNAEVTGNIFGYSSERAINLVNIEDTANIIINSNTYLNKGQLERAGIDFDLNYSSENPPTIEQSEKIFSSIFDLFSTKYYSQVGINDTIILPDGVNESPIFPDIYFGYSPFSRLCLYPSMNDGILFGSELLLEDYNIRVD
jgi:parallel beta-helix repeat protein